MTRVYLDTAPVIYEVEHSSLTIPAALQATSLQSYALIASEMTRLECRVKPLREHDSARLVDYDEFFIETVSEIVQLTRQVMDRAAEIRAEHGFRTPDAIHLAAAMETQCDVFLTNDRRLASFQGISVVLMDDLQ